MTQVMTKPRPVQDHPGILAELERYRGCDYDTWYKLINYVDRSRLSPGETARLISLSPYCNLVDAAGIVIGNQNYGRGYSPEQLSYLRSTVDKHDKAWKGYVTYHYGMELPWWVDPRLLPPRPLVPNVTRYELEVSISPEVVAAVNQFSRDRMAYEKAVNDLTPWYLKVGTAFWVLGKLFLYAILGLFILISLGLVFVAVSGMLKEHKYLRYAAEGAAVGTGFTLAQNYFRNHNYAKA